MPKERTILATSCFEMKCFRSVGTPSVTSSRIWSMMVFAGIPSLTLAAISSRSDGDSLVQPISSSCPLCVFQKVSLMVESESSFTIRRDGQISSILHDCLLNPLAAYEERDR
uniref:Uncharacterized protein n=1 Tax=Cacopsylla melanoneura TaxID=428564 RepID=A0A8D8YTJ4_9HEMI